MGNLLLVEDDPGVAEMLQLLLTRAGHDVTHRADGRSGLRTAYDQRPDLVILDLALPELDGWQLLTRLREVSDVPVMVLSAVDQEAEKVRGLRAGADDYLTKPFGRQELLARIEALLRRATRRDPRWTAEVYDDGVLRVDPVRHRVVVEGDEVALTPIEFRLLLALVRHAGLVLSPEQLLQLAWDDPTGLGAAKVKFALLRLRRKLGWQEPAESPLQSVRGIGYRYQPFSG
ncbi:response regulator transcription factor [Natronosporangium hydrolyticum]|uniref:Response regulator transcription factor n=1 Tax=Natronosporangium hydrolyticum TaxID=2811111 RepID=A0A895YIK9_9ACTN|nr:response regulator transcription factor [Natronosporangium hydrolyticum]QSB15203.1 response regulator transcription factor [Natronosporangium hydrolyticum]